MAWRYDLLQSLGAWTAATCPGAGRPRYELLWLVALIVLLLYRPPHAARAERETTTGLGLSMPPTSRSWPLTVMTAVSVVVRACRSSGLVVLNIVSRLMGTIAGVFDRTVQWCCSDAGVRRRRTWFATPTRFPLSRHHRGRRRRRLHRAYPARSGTWLTRCRASSPGEPHSVLAWWSSLLLVLVARRLPDISLRPLLVCWLPRGRAVCGMGQWRVHRDVQTVTGSGSSTPSYWSGALYTCCRWFFFSCWGGGSLPDLEFNSSDTSLMMELCPVALMGAVPVPGAQ